MQDSILSETESQFIFQNESFLYERKGADLSIYVCNCFM